MRHERWSEVIAVFLKLGAISFGGPAIMGVMQQEIQGRRNWVSRERFVEGLALAAFVGYRVAGVWGAAVSGAAIFLPSFVLILSTVPVLDRMKRIRWMSAALRGISPAVIGMITAALLAMLPNAVLDVTTAVLTLATVVGIVAWRVRPLPAMAAGGVVGAVLKAR